MSEENKPATTAAAEPAANADNPGGFSALGPEPEQSKTHDRMPPATLTLLLTSLGTQALIALGQIPNPLTNKAEVDHDQARHCIDLIGMLDGKTAGNRTPAESQLLEELLYELRMLFVQGGK
jgi:hypothetical protein